MNSDEHRYISPLVNKLSEELKLVRHMLNGDVAHDDQLIHQAIVNFYVSTRIDDKYVSQCREAYMKYGVELEMLFYELCDNTVREYCSGTDPRHSGLYGSLEDEDEKVLKLPERAQSEEAPAVPTFWETVRSKLPSFRDSVIHRYIKRMVARCRRHSEETYRVPPADVLTAERIHVPRTATCIEVPEGVMEIDDCTFGSFLQVKEVVLPSTLYSIGSWAFSWCLNLRSFTIPRGVTFMGYNPLAVTMVSNVRSLSPHFKVRRGALIDVRDHRMIAYLGRESQAKIDRDGNWYRSDEGVEECYTVPGDVLVIGRDAFRGRYSLKKLVVSPQVELIEPNPIADSDVREIECLSPHYKVENNMLLSADGTLLCSYFGKDAAVTVPEGVKEVGIEAFVLAPMEQVTFPATLETVPEEMFRGCEKLKRIVVASGNWQLYLQLMRDYDSMVVWQ